MGQEGREEGGEVWSLSFSPRKKKENLAPLDLYIYTDFLLVPAELTLISICDNMVISGLG